MHKQHVVVQIQPQFCIGLSLLFLLIPIRWVLGWILAVLVHEISHYAALRLLRSEIYSITVGLHGAIIHTDDMIASKELFCALSGPVGGLLLLILARIFPEAAICALVHSVYNLLPIYPLDGGRALRCSFLKFFGNLKGETAFHVIQTVLIGAVFLLGVFCTIFLQMGVLPLTIGSLLLVRNLKIKFPCKDLQQQVQ